MSLLILLLHLSYELSLTFPLTGKYSMSLDTTTWMLATLNECCERYFGWMLNECKGTSESSSSGLWYPGTSTITFLVFQTVTVDNPTFSTSLLTSS